MKTFQRLHPGASVFAHRVPRPRRYRRNRDSSSSFFAFSHFLINNSDINSGLLFLMARIIILIKGNWIL